MQQGHHLSKEERDGGLKNRVRVHIVEAKFWKIQRMEAISITQLLKGFCDDTNWKYVVFWKLHRHFPMTLTWENGYYCNTNLKSEDVVYSARPDSADDSLYRLLMSEMSSLKYNLGEGVVGKIALLGNHCWVFCEDHLTSNLIPECPDEWLLQFAYGIKTIVLVPVIPQGVLQFGSFEVIVEDLRFVNKVKEKFHSFHYSAPMNTIMDSLDESSSITTWWNPSMPSFVDDECYMSRENEMKTNHVEEEIWGNNVRLFGETSNGLGSYFGKSMTEQQYGGTETGRNDIENWNDFFTFPSESEFHVAPGSSFAKEVDPEYGLDDVLSNLYTASDDTSSISNKPITMPIDFSGSIRPNIMTNPYVRNNVMPNDFRNSKISIDEVEGKKVSSKIKKKAKVGNSQRSRPRDRQMIMDRMKELRELVPNGGRCSIHNLLEQTINHMVYLKKITSQAQKIKGSHLERNSRIDFESQLPWPIVIEDLEISGHMRIEMRCNEHGLFLEIAQVIRKMELTILKGVLEDHSTSAWARFIVEVPRGFHRMDVLCPLLHLLQLRTNPVS